MIYCRKCGAALPDDAQYCMKCGAKVVPLPDSSTGPLPLRTDASGSKPSSHQETPSSKKPAGRPVQPRKSPASSHSSSVKEKNRLCHRRPSPFGWLLCAHLLLLHAIAFRYRHKSIGAADFVI